MTLPDILFDDDQLLQYLYNLLAGTSADGPRTISSGGPRICGFFEMRTALAVPIVARGSRLGLGTKEQGSAFASPMTVNPTDALTSTTAAMVCGIEC